MTEVERYVGTEMVAEDRHYPQIRDEHTDSWVAVIAPISELALKVADTDFVPRGLQGNPEAVAAAILYGRELDMAPMTALQQVYMVEGRPTLAAEHLRAMVFAAGHEIAFVETTGSQCTVKGRRKNSDMWTTVVWSLAMAQAAGLTGKKNWQRYPRQMLVARATAELCREIFPDVTHGIPATEEFEDGGETPAGTAAPATGKTTVGRATKKAAPQPDRSVMPVSTATPVGTSTEPLPPPVASAQARPGTAAAPASRPGEGEAVTSPAEPLPPRHCKMTGKHYPHTWQGFTDADGPWHCDGEELPESAEQRKCPHISNGQQCRYYADHDGKHTFGGGLTDPVSLRHCGEPAEHDAHAWLDGKDTYSCSGAALEERHARAAVVDGQVVASESDDVATGPVAETPKPMHTAQTKALQARFKGLGFTDEPDDCEMRLLIASAIVGRDVETFRSTGDTAMNYDEAASIMHALRECRTREDVIAVMAEIAKGDND